MPRALVPILLALTAFAASAQDPAAPVNSALEPATTGGIEVVDRALAKLATHRRLMVIGAHPDDEDTSALALVSRGMGGEAAYLSLTRGDGGQNLIGTELGEGLGVIRTQELLAARRMDGARQFFTRAYDFGYTRSLEETLSRWTREVLLEDVARVIWRFRPQVIVAMFSPEVGGHGQHLASGWAAEEVFPIAGRAEEFPGLVAEGWVPWQPATLFRRTWFDPESATFEVSLGDVEALSGRSMLQIAMRSRSQHRSQDMGMLQPLGGGRSGYEWVAGSWLLEADGLFEGIDTSLAAIAAELPEGETREIVRAELEAVGESAVRARRELSAIDLAASVEALEDILARLVTAREEAASAAGGRVATELLEEKIAVAGVGLAAAAGVGLEATIEHEALEPGGSSTVTASVWNSGSEEVVVDRVTIVAADGWDLEPSIGTAGPVEGDEPEEWSFTATVGPEAEPSRPYYLREPRRGDLFDWSTTEPRLRGLAHEDPELTARFELTIGGARLELEREVVRRTRHQALGEVRRPLRIVPRVEVSVSPGMLLWDLRETTPRTVQVTLVAHASGMSGQLAAETPPGWEITTPSFLIDEAGGQETVDVRINPPDEITPGRHRIALYARLESGVAEGASFPLVEYPHIRPTPLPRPASLEIAAFELDFPDVGPIGYVRGASDRVPELLEQAGMDVELLDADALRGGDLSRFEVIVVGSRAYETDPVLAAANARLHDFVRAGGRLVVQYQQYQFVRGEYAPFPLSIGRPHGRITDETAPVRILDPAHSVFNTPNEIVEGDWDGWVQERGLYFAETWGDEFTPLLAIADPGREEIEGGLLVARLGEGVYVYTGLAFFRQLPAGVGGGYRLLANLLAVR